MAKKSKPKKNKSATRKTRHEIVVRVEASKEAPISTQEIAAPISEGEDKNKSKYMIPKTWVSETQVIRMVQATPQKYVRRRPGKGGGMFDYVEGTYVKKVLNYVFGWNWDFEIVRQEILGPGTDWSQVITTGKLTVKDDKGHTIIKMDNGRADVKCRRNSKTPVDIGNDFKASATDCLKRCAFQLGIASDVMGKQEFKDSGFDVREPEPVETKKVSLPSPQTQPSTKTSEPEPVVDLKDGHGPDGKPTYRCSECDIPIPDVVADYSKKVYGRKLCRDHQKRK